MNTDVLLTVEGLSKTFDKNLFSEISFELRKKEALGIIGGNGTGKTTLLNIISGLCKQDRGNVSVNCRIGYVMQKDGLIERLSVLDNMKYFSGLCGLSGKKSKAMIERSIDLCGLSSFLKKRVSLLSGGMRQRLNIGMALLSEPDCLLLDEASAGLDRQSSEALTAILSDYKNYGSLIIVSHYREDISGLCNRLLDIETGLIHDVI